MMLYTLQCSATQELPKEMIKAQKNRGADAAFPFLSFSKDREIFDQRGPGRGENDNFTPRWPNLIACQGALPPLIRSLFAPSPPSLARARCSGTTI